MSRSSAWSRATAFVLAVSMTVGVVGVFPASAQSGSAAGSSEGTSYTASWLPPEGTACAPSKAQISEAKMLYQVGKGEHLKENYGVAIEYYKDAYRRDCTAHLLLSNISKALESQGRYAAALEVLKIYGARTRLSGDDLLLYHERLIDLTKKVSAAASATPVSASTSSSALAVPSTTTSVTSPSASVTAPLPPPLVERPQPSTVPAWITMGVGVGTMVVGGVMFGAGYGRVSDLEDRLKVVRAAPECQPPTAECLQTQRLLIDSLSPAEGLRTAGLVTLVAGGVVGVGGLLWYLLTPRHEQTVLSKIQVTPGPTGLGLAWTGSF